MSTYKAAASAKDPRLDKAVQLWLKSPLSWRTHGPTYLHLQSEANNLKTTRPQTLRPSVRWLPTWWRATRCPRRRWIRSVGRPMPIDLHTTRQNLPRHIPTYAITSTFSNPQANLFPAALLSSIVTMVSIESYAALVVSGEANTPPPAPLLTTISRLPILSGRRNLLRR